MKKLSIGVQYFPKLIKNGYRYIDKTEHIYHLICSGEGHFLSRPRRFGKSLLISTLESLFQGKKELFQGLWIESSDYEWDEHPVIKLDLSRILTKSLETVKESLNLLLQENAEKEGIHLPENLEPAITFSTLIQRLANRNKKEVVILVDEYDQPLLNSFESPWRIECRHLLQDFFKVTKSLEEFVRYVFITGVSKYSKVSLFSGMNNLDDITLDSNYASLMGISDDELEANYFDEITRVAYSRNESIEVVRNTMRTWYNGYRFARPKDTTKVYNPVSIHKFLRSGEISNYWFGTATPTFAIHLIRQKQYPIENFESGVQIGLSLEESHKIDQMNLVTLLFQTGYLTIRNFDEQTLTYELSFPNEEVRQSFIQHLMHSYSSLEGDQLRPHLTQMKTSLEKGILSDFFENLNILLAQIPHTIHLPKEAHYHSLIYLILRSLNIFVEAEVLSSRGRMDMMATLDHKLYLFEFKMNQSAEKALQQIRDQEYHTRYQHLDKDIILVGVNFDRHERKVTEWIEEKC